MRSGWLWCLMIMACGDTSETPGDAELVVDTAPACSFAPNLRTIQPYAYRHGTMGIARFDGTVCVEDRPELCGVANAMSQITMCAPAETDFLLRMTRPGFETTLNPHGPGDPPASMRGLLSGDDAYVGTSWTIIGGTYPPTTQGHIVVIMLAPDTQGQTTAVAGVQLAITPDQGLLPMYADPSERPDRALTATSAAGIVFIANVPPGSYDLRAAAPPFPSCSLYNGGGWTSPLPDHQLRVPSVAGATTYVGLYCAP